MAHFDESGFQREKVGLLGVTRGKSHEELSQCGKLLCFDICQHMHVFLISK